MATDADGNNLLLGKGKVYFNRNVAGVPVGERFLGNCTTLELTTTDEKVEKFSSAESTSPLLKSVTIRRTVELSIVLDEFTPENLALGLLGDNSALAQGSGSVTDQAHGAVQQGYYYKLIHRNVSAVVVTSDPAGTTFDVTDDYLVDATTGRIYIVPGGAIADDADILVDYAYAADTSATVRGGVSSLIEGMVRFIAHPASGPKYELEVWKAEIANDGAVGFIGDDFGNFTLKGKVLADATNHPTESLYRLIKRA